MTKVDDLVRIVRKVTRATLMESY